MPTLTPAAAEQVRRVAAMSGNERLALRLAARWVDSDESWDYGIGFDEPREHDQRYVSEGVMLLVSSLSQEAVEGLIIDYVELEPGNHRFIFYHRLPQETADGPA